MANTVEQTHTKILTRIAVMKKIAADMAAVDQKVRENLPTSGKNSAAAAEYLRKSSVADLLSELEEIEQKYKMGVTPAVNSYYNGDKGAVAAYNRAVSSDNFVSKVDDLAGNLRRIIAGIVEISTVIKKIKKHTTGVEAAQKALATGWAVEIPLEKRDVEICKCGERMTINAEESKLNCPNPFCMRVRPMVGVVFRDEQFYTQDGQKAKHNGYDTSRHYRFWIDRLQAKEVKEFSQEELDKINYVITRDGYNRKLLQCKDVRAILKDPKVGMTNLNDHVPLLIKTLGGMPPPQLTFQEDQLLSTRFDNAMRLYDIVHPSGGNKPYYPYFIYKLVEQAFKDDPEKLRLLNYIHLQSRETIIKNDNTYKQMAAISGPDDGIIYTPTNSSVKG